MNSEAQRPLSPNDPRIEIMFCPYVSVGRYQMCYCPWHYLVCFSAGDLLLQPRELFSRRVSHRFSLVLDPSGGGVFVEIGLPNALVRQESESERRTETDQQLRLLRQPVGRAPALLIFRPCQVPFCQQSNKEFLRANCYSNIFNRDHLRCSGRRCWGQSSRRGPADGSGGIQKGTEHCLVVNQASSRSPLPTKSPRYIGVAIPTKFSGFLQQRVVSTRKGAALSDHHGCANHGLSLPLQNRGSLASDVAVDRALGVIKYNSISRLVAGFNVANSATCIRLHTLASGSR